MEIRYTGRPVSGPYGVVGWPFGNSVHGPAGCPARTGVIDGYAKKQARKTGLVLVCFTSYRAFWALILMPGPMVDAVTQERIYWPLAAAGLARRRAVMRAL